MDRKETRGGLKLILLSVTAISIMIISGVDYSRGSDEMDTGAEKMIIDGGSKGKVPFGHRLHQKNLGDCNICHTIFPKVKGAIVDLKKKEDLKRKQVMNKLCLKCHRAERMAGKAYGPTTCSKCHVR